ncbi:MAG: LuxR C-terminal-related transcriptional regulator [Sphaerochaetaceae bacterium]|nr:LuxR C-terminal-related transcriptional regulator [Sphaerochaetaceae bacterium]
MESIASLLYGIALITSAMTLALSIASNIMKSRTWGAWYIVFQSTLLTICLFEFLSLVVPAFSSGTVIVVFDYILSISTHALMGFIYGLIPFFIYWILGLKLKKNYTIIIGIFSAAYFGVGLTSVIIGDKTFAYDYQAALFIILMIFCEITLWKNLGKLSDAHSRNICKTINIVVLCLIPTSSLLYIFPDTAILMFPVYFISISVIMMVFYFIRFSVLATKISRGGEVSRDSFEEYKITDREFEVIQYVCKGMTNKEIASEMNISVNTVNNHIANIFGKMNLNSRMDLLRFVKQSPWG